MQSDNLIKSTVGVTMGVLLLVILALPVISSATETETTFTNEGYFTYDAVTDDTNLIIGWDKSEPNLITIGDKDLPLPTTNSNLTIIGSSNFALRYIVSGTFIGLQCYGPEGYYSAHNGSTAQGLTITLSSTTMNLNNGDVSRNYTVGTHGFVINPDGTGPLTLKYGNEPAYVLADSEIYLCGVTTVPNSGTDDPVGVFGFGYGSLDDGITLSAFYGNTGDNTVSFGDVTATVEAVNGYIDLYQLEKFNFDITQNSATVTATYSYFVVPTEVTAEKVTHFDSTEITMLELIPLLLAVSLILGVIAYAIRARLN